MKLTRVTETAVFRSDVDDENKRPEATEDLKITDYFSRAVDAQASLPNLFQNKIVFLVSVPVSDLQVDCSSEKDVVPTSLTMMQVLR